MFSDSKIAAFINASFEPAWQSVREVPTVQIDFGNGRKVKRTLHGNIATYVCMPDGTVVDVLPGIYEPATYLTQLKNLHRLTGKINQATARYRFLKGYHDRCSALLRTLPSSVKYSQTVMPDHASKQLMADTRLNETSRRLKIHRMLAARGPVKPPQITKWLYREVLHADIDDPYMGLGPLLFSNYPFNDESEG